MSGHDAVKSELESPLNEACITDEQAKYYLVVTQYADRCLAGFIDSLKRCGLYERSIVVITGDHDSITRNRYEGRERCELSDRFVPLFILNAPLKGVGPFERLGRRQHGRLGAAVPQSAVARLGHPDPVGLFQIPDRRLKRLIFRT